MAIVKFLFWNTNKNKCIEEIKNIAFHEDIDVIILAENPSTSVELLSALNSKSVLYFPDNPLSQCDKIKIISKFHYKFLEPIFETNRVTARRITIPLIDKLNLIAVHLIDKSSASEESISEASGILKNEIEGIEIKEVNEKTLVVGDFNMNPFERGLIKANGFHATMDSRIAKEYSRKIQNRDYKFFYNPMWNLFGDKQSPTGSYYYRAAEHVSYLWNIFDQVIIRPSLIDNLNLNQIKFITHDGQKKIVTKNGKPNKQLFSDHLPLYFELNF